jgi:glycerate kinase
MAASTYGTGQVVAAAHHTIAVGLGGSATPDGGSVLLAALGGQQCERAGRALPGTPSPRSPALTR